MQYSHVPRYQKIMQMALHEILGKRIIEDGDRKKIGIEYVIENADLSLSISGLSRFINVDFSIYNFEDEKIDEISASEITGALKKRRDGEKLWNFLYKSGAISQIITNPANSILRKSLHPIQEVAGVTIAYNDARGDRIAKYQNAGLVDPTDGSERSWVSYKLSTRKPGFILKSKMSFSLHPAGFLQVTDEQVSTGRFEIPKKKFKDLWKGFAFSKTGILWCHLTQEPFNGQLSGHAPRIICFNQTDISDDVTPLTRMSGFSIEQDNFFENAAVFERRIVIISQDLDKELWYDKFGDKGYLEEIQFDNFPYENDVKKLYPSDTEYFIPNWIADYLYNS